MRENLFKGLANTCFRKRRRQLVPALVGGLARSHLICNQALLELFISSHWPRAPLSPSFPCLSACSTFRFKIRNYNIRASWVRCSGFEIHRWRTGDQQLVGRFLVDCLFVAQVTSTNSTSAQLWLHCRLYRRPVGTVDRVAPGCCRHQWQVHSALGYLFIYIYSSSVVVARTLYIIAYYACVFYIRWVTCISTQRLHVDISAA